MTPLEVFVSLNLVGDIGGIRLKRLLEFFGKPQDILKAPAEKLRAVSGIGKEIAHKICALKKEDLDKELRSAKKLGLEIMTFEDEGYPENLKTIYDPPIVLYVKGELRAEDRLSLGIVGSRRASYYGLNTAEKFAYDLSQKGFTIVSGMARGVDTCAHKGALKAGGRTIAVIGSGFNHLYPPENKELSEEIAKNGAVISEFPLDAKPLREHFPQRNRVISGLSLGILVVEAAKNSGALITADFALEQGREVFALPGKVDSATSFGTNGLIKQGAKLVSGVEDIVEEFGLGFAPCVMRHGIKEKNPRSIAESAERMVESAGPDLLDLEAVLYGWISDQPIALDEIAERAALSIPSILDILLKLQLKKMIKQLPGKQFVRSAL